MPTCLPACLRQVKALLLLLILATPLLPSSADRIIAVVGSKPILESEIQQLTVYFRLMTNDTITSDSAVRAEALRRLIDEALLAEQAQRESIEISRDELLAAVDDQLKTLKDRFDSEEDFKSALLAEGLTEKGLKDRILEEVRRNELSRRLLEKAGLTQIYISPTEVERFYNEHRDSIARVPGKVELAHILIAIKPTDSVENAIRARAWEVLDLLSRNGDFATLARSFSEDPRTRDRGGDWGWQALNELPPELQLVLSQLTNGKLSPPFRGRTGYWILKKENQHQDQVRFRSIFFQVPLTRADTVRARSRALIIRKRALAGVPFDSLAKNYSDDQETGKQGGYLGEFYIEGLMPPFNQVVKNLNTGDISEPILSEHGFHIIKVINIQPERVLTFTEMQDAIRNYLFQQEFSKRLRNYLDRVQRDVFVEIKN
uniref:PpiC domain-containing protein n=1 Tax=candidate division WOR-3 bacterium TaxID=2052148 RepID=A0A7V3PU62_UNCW3